MPAPVSQHTHLAGLHLCLDLCVAVEGEPHSCADVLGIQNGVTCRCRCWYCMGAVEF